MRGAHGALVVTAILSILTANAQAGGEYSIDLEPLLGEQSQLSRARVIEFDFEREFERIESVWIELEGVSYPGVGEPQSEEERAERGDRVQLDLEPQMRLADAFAAQVFDIRSPVSRFEPLEGSFRVEVPFETRSLRPRARPTTGANQVTGQKIMIQPVDSPPETDWSFLHDGVGALRVSWTQVGCGDGGCRYVEHATVDIHGARLVVEGTRR
jgi:hypothetical protein